MKNLFKRLKERLRNINYWNLTKSAFKAAPALSLIVALTAFIAMVVTAKPILFGLFIVYSAWLAGVFIWAVVFGGVISFFQFMSGEIRVTDK